MLAGHEPCPALAVDRHWNLVSANRMVAPLMASAAPHLLEPPLNVLRISLHPDGLAPRILNLGEWRAHILGRLKRQADATADPVLDDLLKELRGYPGAEDGEEPNEVASVVVPMQFSSDAGRLALISTTTVFGTPMDVTLAELAIETFFPADEPTSAALRALADSFTQSPSS